MAKWKKKSTLNVDQYIEQYYAIRKNWIISKEKAAFIPEEKQMTLSKFKEKIEARLVAKDLPMTKENAQKAMKSILTTNVYESSEVRLHRNLTETLKEEGMTSRLYRMGGKTAFKYTSYTEKYGEREIDGKEFKAKGSYRMGQVKVTFWTAKENSAEQYIEFTNVITGQTYLQMRKSGDGND